VSPQTPHDAPPAFARPPFDCIALLLQGGGALGAYQGGVYQALTEAGLHPDWVAGISIGAINAALIAGNPPAKRVGRLRAFWERITAPDLPLSEGLFAFDWAAGNPLAAWSAPLAATRAVFGGAPGFFAPRIPSPLLQAAGGVKATSFYDTSPLQVTLEELVDFDRINAAETRLSVGAVNVRTGNFAYFDNRTQLLSARHIMASGALPPGFAAVEIDGEPYWDGGLVSNTPIDWVLEDSGARQDTLAFEVDLWSARGRVPRTIPEVAARQKEIQFSSRTRASTDKFGRMQAMRARLAEALSEVPPGRLSPDQKAALKAELDPHVYSLVHLIYRADKEAAEYSDYEFSRASMETHWKAGYDDAIRSLRDPRVLQRPTNAEGLAVFDLSELHAD
jgi:NTE family protein